MNIETNNTKPAFFIRIGFKWHAARSRTLDGAKREASYLQSPVFTVWCPAEIYAIHRTENCAWRDETPIASKNSFHSKWK